MNWTEALKEEIAADYFQALLHFVDTERARGVEVFPPREKVFAAFAETPLEQLKVVILGQDPYHGPGQANGLCFSVSPGQRHPPSLQNIFKELKADTGAAIPRDGDLSAWARQGVLLLNTVLTVAAGQAHSHKAQGWEHFTDQVIRAVNLHCPHVVFLLWGKPAQSKLAMIDQQRHTVLCSAHPSPLSAHRGFLGCRHFSQANAALQRHGQTPVQWQLAC